MIIYKPCIFCFSIHASAKEATFYYMYADYAKYIFNPRLREGGDGRFRNRNANTKIFNPRLREGGDGYQISVLIM